MSNYILPFTSSASTLALAGGKGMNLSILARAGFPAPPGFIVTTDAYRAFVAENKIQDRILSHIKTLAPDDPVALDSASSEIATLFEQGHIPDEIASTIVSAYRDLAAPPVAVRSSATAEDLPGLSFAGQQETYLNILGGDAVLDAVKKCWASLWTARAIGYRARNRIPPDEVTLAVVVQQMIASESSGVLFTANPLTGRRAEMVIDASFGLGEAIVSGQVEPDHYVVDTHTWTITDRKLGAKALAILPRAEGGTDHVQRAAAAKQEQALPDAQIVELARLAGRVAEHFGSPQDIEWAWAEGQLYLLQSRPITSLYPLPEVPTPPDVLGLFFNFGSLQGVPDPLTPLGRDMLRLMLGGILRRILGLDVNPHVAFVDAGERLFLNFTEIARDPQLRPLMLAMLERADPAAKQAALHLIETGQLALKHERSHGPPPFIFRLLPKVLPTLLAALIAPKRALAHGLAVADGYLAEVRTHVRLIKSDFAALLAVIESDISQGAEHVILPLVPLIFPAVAMLSVLDRWLTEWFSAPPGSALALMRGLPGNVTSEMNLKLWEAAQTIRADAQSDKVMRTRPIPELIADYQQQALPTVAQHAIEKFLDEYGMRAVTEIDIARPRWRDDPASIFQTLQSYLHLTDPDAAPDAVFRRGAAEAERLAADYLARARRGPWGFFRANALAFAMGRMRALGGARETPKLCIIKLFDIFRTRLLEHARELVAQGQLERAEDIFFVSFETLKRLARGEAVDLKSLVARNRAEYDRELARRQMPRLLLSTGETFYEGLSDSTAGPNDLVGQAVSPGVVEGVVRVVLDPRGTRLQPGEILVCPATDPGWTPLFLAAGGLVMEIGGMVTHGSVVAREYGIPAVVGVQAATTRLQTGQRVRVDGNTGRVVVLTEDGGRKTNDE
jgi:phosphoenolpyruvate synthase/pyruvate phosphate dikinase